MDVFRDRKFALLLYPDDKSHVAAVEIIKRSMDYAIVLHDKDIDADGQVKKAHWHIVITTGSNPRWNTAVAKELGIEDNYIQKVRNLDRMLEYLIHYNDIDKHQYSIDDVTGTLKKRLLASINSADKTEGEKIAELIDVITSQGERVAYSWFSHYCAVHGYWDVYRRSAILFVKMIDEHNFQIDYCNKLKKKKIKEGFIHEDDTYITVPFNGED